MHTFFAPAERDGLEAIRRDHFLVSRNARVKAALSSYPNLAAVLNDKRQILAVNQPLMARLGISNADQVLGLRPGEALDCIHAREEIGGCGTSRHCKDCGAVIAILACRFEDRPVERDCIIFTTDDSGAGLLHLTGRVSPMELPNGKFLLLYLSEKVPRQQTSM